MRNILKNHIRAVKHYSAARPERIDIPILTYHEVTSEPVRQFESISLSKRDFESQMKWLSMMGYKTISLTELISCIKQGRKPAGKHIVITFDDGCVGVYENAFPIMSKFGFKAIVFVVHEAMDGEKLPSIFPHFTASEAREMLRYGFEIGSHSLNHPDLTILSQEKAEKEILESKTRLEYLLSTSIQHFCYPFGKFNAGTSEIVQRAGYQSACSTQIGRSNTHETLFTLLRIPMKGDLSCSQFLYRFFICSANP